MKKKILNVIKILAVLYMLLCSGMYFFQEKVIFFPDKLAVNHVFNFNQAFEEINIELEDGLQMNSVLFSADSSKGLVFYLHGNAGSIDSWGSISSTYTDLGYDLLLVDYRGFGKSEGKISSQDQLFSDIQKAYDLMLENYKEENIVVIGYSIGTGFATHLASKNNPKKLILQAPYYSMVDMMKSQYPFLPTFLLKYKLSTNEYIQKCKMPIYLFHGKQDNLIDYKSSERLKVLIRPTDELILIENQGHNGMTNNSIYQSELKRILD